MKLYKSWSFEMTLNCTKLKYNIKYRYNCDDRIRVTLAFFDTILTIFSADLSKYSAIILCAVNCRSSIQNFFQTGNYRPAANWTSAYLLFLGNESQWLLLDRTPVHCRLISSISHYSIQLRDWDNVNKLSSFKDNMFIF